ncbi:MULTISPECIES: SDR family NAD(P)-dependent oxidoreductase [unclassified Novosphingobium]|jgi:NAD(P)-dependent dehydrogenase (short-subunit alcohol dehydrogenase family)|uniref:SDR family NAD(P)-dependent oxidoreductase n=1 Tax=unclassified Novosphingobium TaxID=2644732 RepID=UPI002D78B65E|nr:SDR family oxidoreductase [Novosphingobium sp. RL4]WRT95177.1 SDR family oxidoreductase [Novosphingobium sp. RL4]
MSRALFDLSGRVVVGVGANSGIGFGFLMGCAKQGADVVVWGRRADRNEAALAELRDAGAGRTHQEAVDVGDEAAVGAAFASTLAAMGRVDTLFANAGFSSRAPSFPDMTSEMYHELLNVNLHGAFYTLREATRHMRARAQADDPGGSIAICGSLSMFHGLQGMEHYAGAKGALNAMMKGLAVEMGQYGVRVNMIAPGFIMTEMTEASDQRDAIIQRFSSITPLGRPGYPHDIEGPGAYLASDASKFHTGDVLVVDGGRMVKSL